MTTLEKKIKDFKYLVKCSVYDGYDCNSETESVIGDGYGYLVVENNPETTGISVFTDMPQTIDPETGYEIDAYDSIEEYHQHLTELHVSEADGEFREDCNGVLWYRDTNGDGDWHSVASDGELGPGEDFN